MGTHNLNWSPPVASGGIGTPNQPPILDLYCARPMGCAEVWVTKRRRFIITTNPVILLYKRKGNIWRISKKMSTKMWLSSGTGIASHFLRTLSNGGNLNGWKGEEGLPALLFLFSTLMPQKEVSSFAVDLQKSLNKTWG